MAMLLPICAAIFFFIVEQSVCHSHAICLSPPAHNMKGKTELSHKEEKRKEESRVKSALLPVYSILS